MSQPALSITELDGALGVLPPSSGKLHALCGTSSKGPLNTPATFAKQRDVIATYGDGPLVEAACHALELYGRPVVIVRTGSSVAGTPGTIDVTGVLGSSVATLTGVPSDDYELVIKVLSSGTIGTAGIAIAYSLDGGRTYSAPVQLGTANAFAVPGAGSLGVSFAAGTLTLGDTIRTRTSAPQWNAAELGAGIDALGASLVTWEIVQVVGPMDAAAFDTVELKINALRAAGKYRAWIGNTRLPTITAGVSESESAYLAALSLMFASKVSTCGQLCAGACKLISSVSGRKYRRPISFAVAAREASSSEQVDNADVNLGALAGVAIRDGNGNPDEHDESLNPGLDDARFTVLRTWEGRGGVFINRPRLFSSPTSDFQLLPHRRVMNVAQAALRNYFQARLNRPVLVNALTGFIREEDALEIEAGAKATLRAALLATPMASAINFVLSRTDNLLTTKTLTGDARITPLAYVEFINLGVGFFNPALQVQAA